MFLVIGVIIGVICALIANSKGRSAIGWFFIGFLLGLIGLIICLVMPNLKEQQQKEEQMKMEQRRLEEQLRQERIKNERFQKYAKNRLDVHDETLNINTRQLSPDAFPVASRMIEGQRADIEGEVNPTDVQFAESGNSGDPAGDSPEHHYGWYFHENGEDHGPLTIRQIRQHIADGIIQHSTYLWHRTFTNWTPAGQVNLFDFGDAV